MNSGAATTHLVPRDPETELQGATPRSGSGFSDCRGVVCVRFVFPDVTMEWTGTHVVLRTVEWLGIFPSLK